MADPLEVQHNQLGPPAGLRITRTLELFGLIASIVHHGRPSLRAGGLIGNEGAGILPCPAEPKARSAQCVGRTGVAVLERPTVDRNLIQSPCISLMWHA
jgi:hypothetical protein